MDSHISLMAECAKRALDCEDDQTVNMGYYIIRRRPDQESTYYFVPNHIVEAVEDHEKLVDYAEWIMDCILKQGSDTVT